jgi:hypothetical protein
LSRNKDRLGSTEAPRPEPSPPIPAAAQNVFSFVAPTEFVKLPSEGRYYPSDHPLFNKETIEIKQMTAKEEDILTSITLIQSGVALERLLESIIVDKTIDPNTLLVGDRSAIVIAARVSGYGNLYKTNITCPECITDQKHNFDLNEASILSATDILSNLPEGVSKAENNAYQLVLPRSNLSVCLRMMTGTDEKAIAKQMELDKKQKVDRLVTTQLSRMISSVNGDSTREAIEYVAVNLPSVDSAYLRKIYKSLVPNLELKLGFVCESCAHQEQMEVPLAAEFFWPDQ